MPMDIDDLIGRMTEDEVRRMLVACMIAVSEKERSIVNALTIACDETERAEIVAHRYAFYDSRFAFGFARTYVGAGGMAHLE